MSRSTFHVSHAVTLWGWCRLNACALLLLALSRAGNCLPCIPSWEPSPPCAALLWARCSSLSAALELCLCFPHHPEFCLSICKLNKEDNNIIGQNVPKWAFQFLQKVWKGGVGAGTHGSVWQRGAGSGSKVRWSWNGLSVCFQKQNDHFGGKIYHLG